MSGFSALGFLDRLRFRTRKEITPAPPPPAPAPARAAPAAPTKPKKYKKPKPRTTNRIYWDDHPEALKIIEDHYSTTRPEILCAMVAPHFPDRFITPNMVIGCANRRGLKKPRFY
jgi:hypothetical protein